MCAVPAVMHAPQMRRASVTQVFIVEAETAHWRRQTYSDMHLAFGDGTLAGAARNGKSLTCARCVKVRSPPRITDHDAARSPEQIARLNGHHHGFAFGELHLCKVSKGPKGRVMADLRTNIASVDPVWDQITEEARQAVLDEPLVGGFVHACILHHKSLDKALSYRVSAKLASNEMSMVVVREIVEEAYASDPRLIEAARADLVAVYERDPACHRLLQPVLYFKGYQAMQAYRIAHYLLSNGHTDLAFFFQMLAAEIFGIDK